MKTNNTVHSKSAVSDDSKVAVILMPAIVGGGDDIDLDSVLEDPGVSNTELPGVLEAEKKIDTNETPEAKAARETTEAANKAAADLKAKSDLALATKYSGSNINGAGDVVDATGKVIKTKAEVDAAEAKAKETATAVEIDGAKYKLNDKGDAVKEDGTVFKTKAELDALEADEEVPLVNEVIQKVGLQPLDDKGKPIVYEDSVEGLIKLTNDLAAMKAKDAEKGLFTAFPKVEKYLKHIAAGGTDSTFFNLVKEDYSKVTIDDKNVEQQKQVLRADLIAKGFSSEKADKYIKRAEDASELLAESQDALKSRQKWQSDTDAKVNAENDARIKQQEENAVKHWTAVQDVVVKTGKIKDVVIPEVDRKEFYQYIAMAVDDEGNSQAVIDAMNEDLETRLLTDFYRFKKYNLSSLVRDTTNKETVKKLRARMDKAKGTGVGTSTTKEEPTTAATDISLDTLGI